MVEIHGPIGYILNRLEVLQKVNLVEFESKKEWGGGLKGYRINPNAEESSTKLEYPKAENFHKSITFSILAQFIKT